VCRVLIIDAQDDTRDELSALLECAGYDVTTARQGAEAKRIAVNADFDLILLDLILPDNSGESVLHEILVAKPDAQVFVVSGVDDVGRRIGALDMGAIDFAGKPFNGFELLAHIRARLRAPNARPGCAGTLDDLNEFGTRSAEETTLLRQHDLLGALGDGHEFALTCVGVNSAGPDQPAAVKPFSIVPTGDGSDLPQRPTPPTDAAVVAAARAAALTGYSDFQVDVFRRDLLVYGRRVELSQREFLLMCHLLRRRGEICTRRELLAHVWGIEFEARTNVVDVYIRRLRTKLAVDTIDTVRNVGYRLSAA
jgi:DNA-binding response OmpR family regulator